MSYYWKHGPHKTTVHYDIPPLKLASVSGFVYVIRKLHIQSCSLSLILMVSVGHELLTLKCHMMYCCRFIFDLCKC